jgi:hypothetical protein
MEHAPNSVGRLHSRLNGDCGCGHPGFRLLNLLMLHRNIDAAPQQKSSAEIGIPFMKN